MNAYRVALILCRAVVVALWWTIGAQLLSLLIMIVLTRLDVAGMSAIPLFMLIQPSVSIILSAIVAGFLQVFASSLAASMTGAAAFEGDAIGSRKALEAPERALGNAGGGLFLLFSGAIIAFPSLAYNAYALLFSGLANGSGGAYVIFGVLSVLIPALLQCLIGFVLSFALGLRRLLKSP